MPKPTTAAVDVCGPLGVALDVLPGVLLPGPGQGMPVAVTTLQLAGQLGVPLPVEIGNAIVTAARIADTIGAARAKAAPPPLSIHELASPGGADLLLERARLGQISRPGPGRGAFAAGNFELDCWCNAAATNARQLVAAEAAAAATALLHSADKQWRALHREITTRQLPEPRSGPIELDAVRPEELARLQQAGHAAARAAALRELRDLLARLLGERPRQSDPWALYYSAPAGDPEAALDAIEQLWQDGIADPPSPWRATRHRVQPGLCLEREAERRAQTLAVVRTRRAVAAAERDRKRYGQAPLTVSEEGAAVMAGFAAAQLQRLEDDKQRRAADR